VPTTIINIEGDEITVEWELEHDILIPENQAIFDVYVNEIKPEKFANKYTWYQIRDAVWEKEKRNYE